jgi:hypothetical protein
MLLIRESILEHSRAIRDDSIDAYALMVPEGFS